jgi:NAD+ diphosphatase
VGLLAARATVIVAMWRGRCLTDGAGRVRRCAAAAGLLAAGGQPVFPGVHAGGAVFAADLPGLDEPAALPVAGASAAAGIRALVADLSGPDAATLACATGIRGWHREQRFWGACGGGPRPATAGISDRAGAAAGCCSRASSRP